jgi:hypothetical protein
MVYGSNLPKTQGISVFYKGCLTEVDTTEVDATELDATELVN